MMSRYGVLALVLLWSGCSQAQPWSQILDPDRAIDWSQAGVGEIPARMLICATLTQHAGTDEINAALARCPKEQSVYLSPGTYNIDRTLVVPSGVTLRGAGADKTILNATVGSGSYAVSLGTSWFVPYQPIRIVQGATAGSVSLTVASSSGLAAGQYLVVTEPNDPRFVTSNGSTGNCAWCDAQWTPNGMLARGQIVRIDQIAGDRLTIFPALFSSFLNGAQAVPFRMSASRAGVEDLQVRANNTGSNASFGVMMCAYCWIKGVESNYTDGDYVRVYWGFHDEIRDSYFSNAYLHKPGSFDSDIQIGWKTTATLVENNIIDRAHASIMLEWGAAGNVIAYNYTTGEFDSRVPNWVTGGIWFHGAHPQFNLLEGNVLPMIFADPIWGSSSNTTAYRNWVTGTNRVCSPMEGRGQVRCSGNDGHFAFQASRAVQISYLSSENNFVANVVGSAPTAALTGYGRPLKQAARVEYPATRSYDAVAYGWSIGYGETNDDGKGTGCAGGTPPCHAQGVSSRQMFHGNYTYADRSILWSAGRPRGLPPSLYRSAKPEWWNTMPFPSIGPDVTGGDGPEGHTYGNPARACYLRVMGGSEGGADSPLRFNAQACYGQRHEQPKTANPHR
jgi:hypothetical protein